MRQVANLGILLVLFLIAGCSVTPGECAAGFVLENGFCVRITCAPGQRIVDNACAPIECPPGSTLQGEACVSDDTTTPITEATPPGGLYSGAITVTLTANEPAVVFYTIDGSTPTDASTSGPSPLRVDLAASADLRFFSVDPAGNAESPLTEEYEIDDAGPDEVTGLTATPAAMGAVDLAWTNPSDASFVAVLAARGRGLPLGWTPENGVEYQVGDIVGADIVIVAAANVDNFTDDEPWGDLNGYSVWARDEAFNYSAVPATVEIAVPVPAQPFTVNVDLANETATMDGPMRDLDIEVAPQLSAAKDVLRLRIRATNKMTRPYYNLKAAVDAPAVGTVAGNGVYDGDQTFYFGPNAVAAGERSLGGDVIVTAIPGGTTTLSVQARLFVHPLFIRRAFPHLRFADSAVGPNFGAPMPPLNRPPASCVGGGSPDCNRSAGASALSPDGLRLYAGFNTSPDVVMVDLTTLTPTLSAALDAGVGETAVTLSPDGQFLYVALTTDMHKRRFASSTPCTAIDTHLVKLDAMTLVEVDRADLLLGISCAVGARATKPAVSADGSRVAVGVTNQSRLFYLDTSDLSVVFEKTLGSALVTNVAISPNNSHVYVGFRDVEMTRVDTTTEVETPVSTGYTSGQNVIGTMQFESDGLLYFTRARCAQCIAAGATYATINRVDPSNAMNTAAPTDVLTGGFAIVGPLAFAFDRSAGTVQVMTVNNFNVINTVAVTGSQGHVAHVSQSPPWRP